VAESDEVEMQFILGIFLFVGVLSLVDARVPWPIARRPRSQK
jgi:hypothetical protein